MAGLFRARRLGIEFEIGAPHHVLVHDQPDEIGVLIVVVEGEFYQPAQGEVRRK